MEPHRRTSTHPPAALAVGPATLALLLTLAACGSDAPTPAPSSGASTASAPSPSEAVPDPVAVTAGDVALEVTTTSPGADDPAVQVSPDAGTATVSLDPAAASEVTLTSPGAFAAHPDGSVTVHDGDTAVGGLSAPSGARFVAVDATHLGLSAHESAGDAVTTTLGTLAVAATDWGEREGGRSLAVTPTDWARIAGQAGVDLAWAEITSAEPEADVPTMRDQLECHAIGAPDKDTWNLEPWRPDVGLLATMAARCNPVAPPDS